MKTKFIFRAAIACILTAAMFTGAVSAAVEDDLKSLGLFIGTESGFELDRAPTIAEAAVILVRLLGKEAETIEKNYECPFPVIPEWVSPYVGYMYENDLTDDLNHHDFTEDKQCYVDTFCCIVLRALGYTREAGDYDYTYTGGLVAPDDRPTVMELAEELGLLSDTLLANLETINNVYNSYFRDYHLGGWQWDIISVDPETGEETIFTEYDAWDIIFEYQEKYGFKRSDCADIIQRALNTNIKGTDITLLERLSA